MVDVFIGYASEDRSRVKPLAEALEAQDWSVWWDWKSIPVGKTWRQAIEEGLEAARSVLVLWSNKSIGKDWVIDEADFGKERKILVPVIIDDVRPPIGFRQIQAVPLIDWQEDSKHPQFKKLLSALSSILGPSPLKVEKSVSFEKLKLRDYLAKDIKFLLEDNHYNYEKVKSKVIERYKKGRLTKPERDALLSALDKLWADWAYK